MLLENIETHTQDITETGNSVDADNIRSLLAALNTGEIQGQEEAIKFLKRRGMNSDQARAAVREIINFKEKP